MTPADILLDAADAHNTTVADIIGPARFAYLVEARRAVIDRVCVQRGLPVSFAARLLRRDRATINHHLNFLRTMSGITDDWGREVVLKRKTVANKKGCQQQETAG